MALSLTNETQVYTSLINAPIEPLIGDRAIDGVDWVIGEDGVTYTFINGATGIERWRIDRDTFARTYVDTPSNYIATAVTAKSSIPRPDSAGVRIVGYLRPKKYLLIAETSLSGSLVFRGTRFSLWYINSSGNFVCEAGIHYDHGSQINRVIQYVGVCGISNDKSDGDPIVVIYSGGTGVFEYFRGWRLPGINDFISANGTYNITAVSNLNNIDFQGAWSHWWGPSPLRNVQGTSLRPSETAFWMLPYKDKTRVYFYVGPGDILIDGTGATAYNYQMSLLHGDQFTGYLNLDHMEYSNATAWVPDLTRTVDLNYMVTPDGDFLIPFTLYNADGVTIDTVGAGDFAPGGNITKLRNGKWLVTFGAGLPYNPTNTYTGSLNDFVCRWMAFIYNPDTGQHRLVSRGTFQPTSQFEVSGYVSGVTAGSRFYQPVIEYDEDRKRLFFNIAMYFTGLGTTENTKTLFGMVDKLIDFNFIGEPCFCTETDATYYDFTAKYPD